jgi:hypothetical protein
MKFGFLQVYNEFYWVGPQIDQAMLLCDELVVIEGSQFTSFKDIPERSIDGTLDIISDKIKEYPNRIKLEYTSRKHNNYRRNQCENFNKALSLCNEGDYFLALDADEFYTNDHIKYLNNLMNDNKADIVISCGHQFAFGFKWKFVTNGNDPTCTRHILKKTPNLFFVPTSNPRNAGKIIVKDENRLGRFHYNWVKPKERMRIRHRTSGFYPNMLQWFDSNWDRLKLKDGKRYNYYGGHFILKRYNKEHPEVLDNHPWKNEEDIRKI